MTTHTPLERARAAGYTLGEWSVDPTGRIVRRCWVYRGRVVSEAARASVNGTPDAWACAPDSDWTFNEQIPAADLPTLRRRAEEWLGVTRSDDDAVRAHMASLINSIRADRDRLAAEVERLRAGCRRIANSTENRMTYSGEEARQIAARVVVGLRSLLTPTRGASTAEEGG